MDDNFLKIFMNEDLGSIEELQELAKSAEYLSKSFTRDVHNDGDENKKIFDRAGEIYSQFWNNEMLDEIGKKSLQNFSKDAPVNMLADGLENVILSAVDHLIETDQMDDIVSVVGAFNKDEIDEISLEYAKKHNKNVEDFTAEDMNEVLSIFSDDLLANRMKQLQEVYQLKGLFDLQKQMSADEDFNENVLENHDKIDHIRRTQHTRTKAGASLSLDELQETENDILSDRGTSVEEIVETQTMSELEEICLNVLNEEEKEIFEFLKAGKTQEEIAEALGYKTQSAISKKINKMKEKIKAEIARQNM